MENPFATLFFSGLQVSCAVCESLGYYQNYCHILPRGVTKLQGFLNFCYRLQCTCLHTPFILHFFWDNSVPDDWKLFSNSFKALGESADENMVKEISVLNRSVWSKAPDRKQIEEENIFLGYLKNESCFPALAGGPRTRFWVSKHRRCFS